MATGAPVATGAGCCWAVGLHKVPCMFTQVPMIPGICCIQVFCGWSSAVSSGVGVGSSSAV